MRVISLWQPYASLIMARRKKFETRHWAFPEHLTGETIAIHAAAKAIPKDGYGSWVDEICANTFGSDYRTTLPRGAILGTVKLVECWRTQDAMVGGERVHGMEYAVGNWEPGRYAWELGEINKFDTPVPAKGKQGWWSWEP